MEILGPIIIAVLGSSALTAIILAVINRKKTQAETKQITISSEIELSGATLNYAKEVKSMFDDLKKEYNELKEKNRKLEDSLHNLEGKYEKVVAFLEKLGYDEEEILE